MRQLKSYCIIILLFIEHLLILGENVQVQPSLANSHSIDTLDVDNDESIDWHNLLEEMAENGLDAEQMEERLTELATDPIPLNNASREMLESIPILNADQVENLSYYLYRYGPMVSLSELMLVEGMDARTLRWLKPFVRIGEIEESPVEVPPMKKALMYGKHDFRLTMGSTIQPKAGYEMESDSSTRYLGSPLHACFRYGFNYKGQLQWGIVMEKDPGERWWNVHQNGIDYISFHLLVKDSKHRNTAILGDYNVQFGQGLVCGNAFSLGKNTSGVIPEQTGTFLARHFSVSEIKYFRGAAFQFALKPYHAENKHSFAIDFYPFLSLRRLDSFVENGTFESISETGLHRTLAETALQNKLKQSVLGSHLAFRCFNLTGGITALCWLNNATATASLESWRVFNIIGRKGGNVSVNWRMIAYGILTYGEVALDQDGHSAMLAGASFKPYPRMSISLLGRKYSPQYQALFGNAFSEGTSTRNEEGMYASADVQLAKRLHLAGYVDVFRFPWLNYAVNTPTQGQDVAAELSSTVGRNGLIKLMVKCKIKEKYEADFRFPTHPTQPFGKSQGRLQINQKQGIWSMKTTLYANKYEFGKSQSWGVALAQDLGMEPIGNSFAIMMHAVLYSTESFENRIYLWEKDLPGTFSMPMLYGQGCRLALYVKYGFKNLDLQLKLSDSVQPGMETLGDGLELIRGNRRTEARLQLCWKF